MAWNKHVGLFIFVWLALLYVTGITIFTRGFLLKRSVVSLNNTCFQNWTINQISRSNTPVTLQGHCWLPAKYKKAVVILVDGLRYDFVDFDRTVIAGEVLPFQNKMSVVHELLATRPKQAKLFRIVADPPTTTMQRIKGIITGGLPTFIDAGGNFASFEITEDNIVDGLITLKKKIVFMGDDTWVGLLPCRFHKTMPFPSFNVKDLHTVDDGILKHLAPQIRNASDWDIIIAHFLGVDHCGHTYGPYHEAMADKLIQMNSMLRSVVESLDDDTVLFLLGDHGMTASGDHGGDSPDEVNTALFVYSPGLPLISSKNSTVRDHLLQIDFASTFALLLGIPVPFGNLGLVLYEFFDSMRHNDITVLYLNVKQVEQYFNSYLTVSDDFTGRSARLTDLQLLLTNIDTLWANTTDRSETWRNMFMTQCVTYVAAVQSLCRETWATFDLMYIFKGLFIVFWAIFISICLCIEKITLKLRNVFPLLGAAVSGLFFLLHAAVFPVFKGILGYEIPISFFFSLAQLVMVYMAVGISVRSVLLVLKENMIPVTIAITMFSTYFSNSYVVNEDSVTSFLALTILLCIATCRCSEIEYKKCDDRRVMSGRNQYSSDTVFLVFIAVAAVCIKLESWMWQCREEQKRCAGVLFQHSVEWSSGNNSVLFASCAAVAAIVLSTRWMLRKAGNLNGFSPVVLCASYSPVLICVFTFIYWVVQFLVPLLPSSTVSNFSMLPNVAMVTAVLSLLVVYLFPLAIHEEVTVGNVGPLQVNGDQRLLVHQVFRHLKANWQKHLLSSSGSASTPSKEKPLVVYGLASVFSAALLIAVTITITLLIVISRLGYAVSYFLIFVTAMATLQCFAMLKSRSTPVSKVIYSVPWSWVVLWSLMSSVGFYGTGHQQTFPSIHWESAVIGSHGDIGSSRILPALKVLSNTFASTITHGLWLPALILSPISSQVIFQNGETFITAESNKGEFCLLDNPKFFSGLYNLCNKYLVIQGLKVFGCMAASALHRRHLMVWKIFAPRFLFEALNFIFSCVAILMSLVLLLSVQYSLQCWLKIKKKQGFS